MTDFLSFTANCPTCASEGVVVTYTRAELLRLLELGYPVEAYCTECDVDWLVGPGVRTRIAQLLAANFLPPRPGFRVAQA